MTNEIQIVNDPMSGYGTQSPRQPDWSQGPAPMTAATPSIFLKMHKLLRGRYRLAITLAILCAIIGLIIGWFSRKPLYQSVGVIQVQTTRMTTDPSHPEINVPDAGSVIAAAKMEIESQSVIRRALAMPQWAKYRAGGDAQIARFQSALDVEFTASADLLKLTFSDPDPVKAQAGMNALCAAYTAYNTEADPTGWKTRNALFEAHRQVVIDRLNDLNRQLSNLANEYQTTQLDGYLQARWASLSDLQNKLAQANMELVEYDTQYKSQASGQSNTALAAGGTQTAKPAPLPPMTPDMIAPSDPQMRTLLNTKMQLEMALPYELDNAPKGLKTQQDQRHLAAVKQQIELEAAQYNAMPHLAQPTMPGMTPMPSQITQADVEQKRTVVTTLQQQLTDLKSELNKLGANNQRIKQIEEEIVRQQEQADQIQQKMDYYRDLKDLAESQAPVVQDGDLPADPSDHNRMIMAAAGFLGGAALPFCVLMLIGLLDGRYRYSDQTGSEMAGLMMLGMLPNLPDLLSDPEQAATAAHCVHQIRTMLQINGHVTDRRVYTITSASSGDGKTSLTLALGLSFAASGSRTLLIDADLVGGGLTARLGVRVDHGVLEAMANTRRLEELTRATDVTDLSILPVGLAMGSYTGAISPVAVRKLITEARKSYDTILIDTGPILGSIEASPVAAASDGVIICVARGQQRSLVDRALLHLQSIGARFAGMVFNRAQAQDFERSVSRMSLQSLPQLNGNGRSRETNGTNHIGPVAKAVASSVRTTVGSSDVN